MSRAILAAGLPRWLLGSIGAAFAALVVLWALRRARPAAIAGACLVYAALIAALRAIPDEVVHLAEYGVLGLLVHAASGHRGAAIAAAALTGLLDEWTQGATPGRVFDWKDVVVNAIAAAVPVMLSRSE